MRKKSAAPPQPTIGLRQWKLSKLTPYAANARLHSQRQVGQIADSIREFGFVNPVLVAPDGTIIAGHGRVEAAAEVGLESIPVIVLGHLTEAQTRALRVVDNTIPLNATWDAKMLQVELQELSGLDVDLQPFDLDDLLVHGDPQVAAPAATRAGKTKGTIFVTVLSSRMDEAKAVMAEALKRAGIDSNL